MRQFLATLPPTIMVQWKNLPPWRQATHLPRTAQFSTSMICHKREFSFNKNTKFWSNYSDLTRPHPKWWFSKGNPLISGKSSLVKYYNLARKLWASLSLGGFMGDVFFRIFQFFPKKIRPDCYIVGRRGILFCCRLKWWTAWIVPFYQRKFSCKTSDVHSRSCIMKIECKIWSGLLGLKIFFSAHRVSWASKLTKAKKRSNSLQAGPLPVIRRVITPFLVVITPVTHL